MACASTVQGATARRHGLRPALRAWPCLHAGAALDVACSCRRACKGCACASPCPCRLLRRQHCAGQGRCGAPRPAALPGSCRARVRVCLSVCGSTWVPCRPPAAWLAPRAAAAAAPWCCCRCRPQALPTPPMQAVLLSLPRPPLLLPALHPLPGLNTPHPPHRQQVMEFAEGEHWFSVYSRDCGTSLVGLRGSGLASPVGLPGWPPCLMGPPCPAV